MSDSEPRLPYRRHVNGSGKIYDTSEACERSYVDRASRISDDSSIWSSKIIASSVSASVISNAVIRSSWITASDVHGAVIDRSTIAAEFIGGNVRIEDSTVLGKSRVAHSASCQNVRFRDLTVKGNAVLRDWPADVFEGAHGYITRGTWTRPPRVFQISPQITLTEGVPGFAFVHCLELPIEHWLKIGHRYGRACRWTPDEVKAVRKVLHMLR